MPIIRPSLRREVVAGDLVLALHDGERLLGEYRAYLETLTSIQVDLRLRRKFGIQVGRLEDSPAGLK
jgi:hypothetical protein